MKLTVLITGASRGIGLALTREFLKGGHRVLAGARTLAKASELQKLRHDQRQLFEVVELDVTSDQSVNAAAATVAGMIDGLDVLVNNAAVFPEKGNESILEIPLEHFRHAFETNVLGIVRVTRAFMPLVEKGKKPRVVNISSEAGSLAGKDNHDHYAYSASKAALNMVTRGMAAEFGPRRVCVVAMLPGWVKTDMGGHHAQLEPEESARAIAKTISSLTMEKTSLFIDRMGGAAPCGW